MSSYNIRYVFEAVDKVSGVMSNISSNVEKSQRTFSAFRQVGATVTAAGVAMAGGLGFAVKKAAEFDSAMSEVKAISGASGKEFKQLETKAREMGATTSFSASEAAEGMKYMALAGWDTKQIMGGIGPVLHLAEAGALDLGRASDLVTDSMAAMGLEVKDLPKYLDQVAQTSRKSNTDIDALMEAFVIAGGTFRQFNVPTAEAAAMLGVLANRGFKGAEAGTAMNAIMTNLTSGTGQAGKALEELGISAFDADGNFKGLEVVLLEVKEKLAGMTEEEQAHYRAMIAGKEHMKSFQSLLNGLGEEYTGLKDDITNSNGALKEMRDEMKNNLQGALENLSSAFDEMAISIGHALMPAIEFLVSVIQSLVDWFNGLSDTTKSFIVISAALVTTLMLIVGPLLLIIGFIPQIIMGIMTLMTVVTSLSGVLMGSVAIWGLVAAAAIAAVALIIIYWEPIKEFFSNLWESIKELGTSIWDTLKDVWASAVEFLKETWTGVKEFFSDLWASIEEIATVVWDVIIAVWQTVVETFKTVFQPMTEFFATLTQTTVDVATNIWDTFTNALSAIWANIRTVAAAAWELIKNAILGPILLLINLATGDFKSFGSNLAQIWNNIKTSATTIWNALKSAVITIITSLASVGAGVVTGFSSTLSSLWSAIRATAVNIWNALKAGVLAVITSLANTGKSIMSGMRSSIISIWNGLKSSVISIANGLKNGAINAWNTLKSTTASIFNSLKGVITNPLKAINLFSIGVNIIQGLVRGIKSMYGAVKDAISNVANTVQKGIKKALKIKSPSRVMIEIGEFTGEGLAKGIDAMVGDIEKASVDMAIAATPDIPPVEMSYTTPDVGSSAVKYATPTTAKRGSLEDTRQKQPVELKLMLGDSTELARYFISDINDLQGRQLTNANFMRGVKF